MSQVFTISVVLAAVYFGYKFLSRGEEGVLVEIPDGKLLGNVMVDRKGGEFLSFLSIPYAQAPVGELRFKAPLPAKPWSEIRAPQEMPFCKQNEFLGKVRGVEDCLYLNVYTKNLKPTHLQPVMVYIHGGSFMEGTGSVIKYGPQNLLTEDIVLVTINYRLGVFGFLSLESSDDISANNGLKDQVLALQWVQKNIKNFGGDPNSVTIFGESAGAASAHLHMISPMSKGLFHRVIAQSGTALDSWSIGAKNTAIPLAERLGVDTSDPKQIGKQLRKFSCDEILDAQLNINWDLKVSKPWNGAPIVEGNHPDAFLPDHPKKMLQSGDYQKLPLMLGCTNREALIFAMFYDVSGGKYAVDLAKELPYDLTNGDEAKTALAGERAKRFYYGEQLPKGVTHETIDFLSDSYFRYATIRTARQHAQTAPVYLYEFSADTKLNFFKHLNKYTATFEGASHVDDLGYLFTGEEIPEVGKGSLEELLVERVVRLWTNFAKFGKPTPEKSQLLLDLDWKPVEAGRLNFMNISNSLEVGELNCRRIEFWDELYTL